MTQIAIPTAQASAAAPPNYECHRPRKRAIQYAAASRSEHNCLRNTGRIQPVEPGDESCKWGRNDGAVRLVTTRVGCRSPQMSQPRAWAAHDFGIMEKYR
ncbi:hypothetical protein XI02_20610 [Bradyrhizobium sp. CCBAU 21365]|nr:hypothetical protein XI02_20610 [Bradyrhizobium sp. CCBAU 21365]